MPKLLAIVVINGWNRVNVTSTSRRGHERGVRPPPFFVAFGPLGGAKATKNDQGAQPPGRDQPLVLISRNGDVVSMPGSFGRPSTRSPTMLRSTSSDPPAMRMPGRPTT